MLLEEDLKSPKAKEITERTSAPLRTVGVED